MFKKKFSKEQPRIVARQLAKEISSDELEKIQAGGAGGTGASTCTGSDNSSCDLDHHDDYNVGFSEG